MIYHGARLLIKRGISEKGDDKGLIVSRYEIGDFCFTNAINGVKLISEDESIYLMLLGIFWSSFARYYFFNTSAEWGYWHHEIYFDDELLQLPIPEKLSGNKVNHVISIVKKLRDYNPKINDLLNPEGITEEKINKNRHKLESELDKAVFDLYDFSEMEISLIKDCCNITIPFFYKSYSSIGSNPVIENGDTTWIQNYAECFSKQWKPYIRSDETLRADLCVAASGNIIAMEFYPADVDDKWDLSQKDKLWAGMLDEIETSIHRPMGISEILLEGVIQIITNNSIIIIKRNEKRFWTRSVAYEDAEAAIAKRMLETMPRIGDVE
jgi:hypothetical protein